MDQKAVAMSDGSFYNQQGAAAWEIKGYEATHHIKEMGWTHGLPEDQSAY